MTAALQALLSIAVGIVIGGAGVIVHNYFWGWFPVGLILGLLGALFASRLLGIRFGRRGVKFCFFLGWSAITLRGASFGNGDELLIMSNGTGSTFLALGFLLVLVSVWSRV